MDDRSRPNEGQAGQGARASGAAHRRYDRNPQRASALRRWRFFFSRSHGKAPVNFGTKIKRKLDAAMLAELGKLSPWVNHDIRRSVKSNMSALRIPVVVSEAVLAHVQPGIASRYDKHDYQQEKLEALEAWGARLAEIIEPTAKPLAAENVVKLQRQARHAAR
jgi:hypothetical protein